MRIIDSVAFKEVNSYFSGMKYNGIDKVVASRHNIKVVKAEQAHHGNILEQEGGAIPEGTIDSELFGHKKGSFTGAAEELAAKFILLMCLPPGYTAYRWFMEAVYLVFIASLLA
jgi:sigma54-dependent transcription regulator